MKREENVINYYVICNRLKDVIRTGWKDWEVNRDRIESVAEHIYGTQMLAIAIYSEYKYDIDIYKVIMMLAIHELGECFIGDITKFQISKSEKEKIEHEAVHKILSDLIDGDKLEELFLEFDSHSSKEAKFAYQCDKLECCLQCKLYDLEGCVNLDNIDINSSKSDEDVKRLLSEGNSWSTMWIKYWKDMNVFDDNFMAICDYAIMNDIDEIQ